ncbi:MAG: PAS domain S-box protein, partial [Planctomycetota bacterium]
MLESLSVGVYRIAGEEEGRFVVANEALARIHGYASAEELLDVPVVELYEDPEDRRRLIEELRRKGQVRNREVRARRKDGTSVWTSVTVSVRYGADGEIKWLDGISEDITERKGAREALRESEARFQRLSDATFEGIVVQRKREIVDASSAFAGMFGYEIDELVGMDGVGLLVPEQRETVMAILESGQTEPYETIGLRKDGTTFPMEVQAREMQWAGETVRVAAVRDITERKRAEEALRESEERHRAIVEDQSELLNRYTPDFRLTFVNEATCRYFDRSREELLGKSFMPFIPEPYRAQVRGELESLSKESPATTIENPVLLDNGELRWHQWTNRAIFDENGQIVQYQSVGRDITERKRAEEALRQERDRAQRYLDVAGVMFVALNAKGEVALINQKGSEVLGYEQVEIIGKNWFDSFLP